MKLNRREAMMTAGLAAAGLAAGAIRAEEAKAPARKGRIRQCACQGALGKGSFEEKARLAKELGLIGIDLVRPPDWPALKANGLICSMVPSHALAKGINHTENHAECLAALRESIEAAAGAGFPNVITLSGNRSGIDEATGAKNCIEALKQVAALAEQKKVTICLELLNSKRNHKDYQCDRTPWGVEVVKGVGSPNVKLLYDIYHMQIMEGDVIATLRENMQYIGHIHTAGVPGRHEIDDSQELYYPAIMRAIAEAGFTGLVAHEYTPLKDPVASLKQAIATCDV